MATWKQGQSLYSQLVSNLAEHVSPQCEFYTIREAGHSKVLDFARVSIVDFVNDLKVRDLLAIHEYLMYMTDMKPDPRFPTYVYSGGDRIAAVTRYLQKNIDLELAKQFA